MPPPKTARNQEIMYLRFQERWTLPRIAAHFNISKQRVDQIIQRAGVKPGFIDLNPKPPKYNPVDEKFWTNVDTGGEDECWEWQLSRYPTGYGRIYCMGKHRYAHRVAWMFRNGSWAEEIPEDLCVLHHCDNPPCCNPAHLFLGTYADNTQDSIRKGRWGDRRGEQAPSSKLTEKQVLRIREMWPTGEYTQIELGEMFEVRSGTISSIVHRKSWTHI